MLNIINRDEVDLDVIPVEEYDGLGANIVNMMLDNIFEERSMIRVREGISEETMKQVPIFNSIEDYLKIIKREEEIGLTKIGNLPPKFVKEIYENNEIKEYDIEKSGYKLKNEMDSKGVELTRVLANLCRYTKVRKNKLSLTKLGKDALKNKREMFETVMKVFARGYNWGYLDYSEEGVYIASLASYNYYLIGKYGEIEEDYSFYLEKLLEAFPTAVEGIIKDEDYRSKKETFAWINFLRTFERYMEYLGLVVCENEYSTGQKIKKTKLFDKVIDLSAINRMMCLNQEEIKKHKLEGFISKLDYKGM